MKKNKLVADVDFNFKLLAIVSPLREYKLAWLINHELGINLIKQADQLFEFIDSDKLSISNYKHQTEHTIIRLLVNRTLEDFSSSLQHLIPELRQFDYLLMVEGPEHSLDPLKIRDHLRGMTGVQLVNLVSIEQLKSKENLIF